MSWGLLNQRAAAVKERKTLSGYCKEPLPRKGLKFCGRRCYLRYSVEVSRPIQKAQARLAEMRASGLSPGHGGEAAQKRGAALAENNRRRITGRGAALATRRT
jgi:hypothetical protein